MTSRSLAENIERGRTAIAAAKERGINTEAWEARVAELEQESLLAWAAEIAEEGTELQLEVSYVEAPLRRVTTDRVSWYAGYYLTTIAQARLSQAAGRWGRWTPQWWKEREDEALGALRALRGALEEQESD